MRFQAVIIALATVLPASRLAAREQTDSIVLDNGDRLTGEIKRLKAGVLYLSLNYVDGTIEVQWSKVAKLESRQLFIIQTEDGSLRTGSFATPDRSSSGPVVIRITETSGGKVDMERSSIVSVGETSENFWQQFSGEINSGVMQSKGNDTIQYNLATQVEYRRERWGATSSYSSNLSSSSGSTSSTRNQVSVGAYHYLNSGNYFYAGLGNMLQSTVQDISIQGSLGAGIGRFFKNTDRARISVLAGLALQTTEYSSTIVPLNAQRVAAGLLDADLMIFKFKKTDLSVNASLFSAFSEPSRGRIYFNTNVSYYLKIIGNLKWNISFYGNWDSRPPSTFSGSDYGVNSGLSWTFGGK